MKHDEIYSLIVDRYIGGELPDEEQIAFEKQLRHDLELQQELQFQHKLHAMIADTEVIQLKQQLDTIYAEQYTPWLRTISAKASKNRKLILRVTALAASLAIIFGSITTLVNSEQTGQQLFDDYYTSAEISMSFRSAADQIDVDLRNAMQLYENNQYSEAIVLFEKVLQEDNSRIGLNLYAGISNLEIEQYDKANKNFQSIIDKKPNAFVESAEWYLALAYLRTDEMDKAREVLTGIVNRDGYFRKDAKKILRKLK